MLGCFVLARWGVDPGYTGLEHIPVQTVPQAKLCMSCDVCFRGEAY